MSTKDSKAPQGRKTHEQHLRMLERKPDLNETGPGAAGPQESGARRKDEARQSEFPVSFRGLNQESQHNKR